MHERSGLIGRLALGMLVLAAVGYADATVTCGVSLTSSDCLGVTATVSVTQLGNGKTRVEVHWGGVAGGLCPNDPSVDVPSNSSTWVGFPCLNCNLDVWPCSGNWGGITTCPQICGQSS